MRFRILGPLEVVVADQRLRLAGMRQRTILALLLLEAGRVVAVDRLVTAVWDQSPPSSARQQIRICVSGLRRALREAGLPGVIVTQPPGYRAQVEFDDVDVEIFERRVSDARRAAADGHNTAAVAELRAALGLWRGPALEGITSPVIQGAAARLDERRMMVLEETIEHELGLGRHHELVGELLELVAGHPLRERLRG